MEKDIVDALAKYFKDFLTNSDAAELLRKLGLQPEIVSTDLLATVVSMAKEKDHPSVLFAVSYIEERLKILFQTKMLPESKKFKELTKGYGPLSTFSSKIDMAYMLGWISKERFKDLHIFRQIRNEFAHSPAFRDFSEQKIQDLMSNINTAFPVSTVREKFDKKFIELVAYIDLQIIAAEKERNNQ